jgi:2-C-methyl-D-erythritol 4-phosphate cytidylyltransferase
VVVAAPAGFELEVREVAADASLAVEIVTGGATRAKSVSGALEAVPEAELIAVHDAARPLLTAELIDALVATLAERPDAGGVVPAAAITDTIKRAGSDGAIVATEDRSQLWAAQTPQVFRAGALRVAHAADPASVAAATDDAMLVEASGAIVLIEPTSAENFKVTTGADLRRAALILRERS